MRRAGSLLRRYARAHSTECAGDPRARSASRRQAALRGEEFSVERADASAHGEDENGVGRPAEGGPVENNRLARVFRPGHTHLRGKYMTKTIVGLFDNSGEAQRAVVELIDSGIPREDIGVTSRDYNDYEGSDASRSDSYRDDEGIGDKLSNFFSNLFGDDKEYASHYSEAVTRGGTVVTVDAETEEIADRAEAIMNRFGGETDEHGSTSHRQAAYAEGADTNRADLRKGNEARIPVMEEELRVGKREVEGGGVRVRTRVVERPVEEAVRLREERVHVERRPVNRAVTEADLNAFREGEFELRERSEEAVVDKTARVVEEVAINKEVGERTETVRDTVRRTDVDVEETGGARTRSATASTQGDNTDPSNRRNR